MSTRAVRRLGKIADAEYSVLSKKRRVVGHVVRAVNSEFPLAA
jgi:hypothetical protein